MIHVASSDQIRDKRKGRVNLNRVMRLGYLSTFMGIMVGTFIISN